MDGTVTNINEINSALLHALTYVKKENFKNISSTKDIDKFVLLKVDAALKSDLYNSLRDKYKKLAQLFVGYNGFGDGLKKKALNDACDLLAEIRTHSDNLKNTVKSNEKLNEKKDISKAWIDYENSEKKLDTPVRFITGVGPKLSVYLDKKGIKTVADLLNYFPFKYSDRREIKKISELTLGELAVFIAKVIDFSVVRYGPRKIFEMVVADEFGSINLKWFKYNNYLIEGFKRGDKVMITGVVRQFNFTKELHHPEIKKFSEEDTKDFRGIRPVYSETEGLKQNTIRKIIANAVNDFLPFYVSPLDYTVSKKLGLTDAPDAVRNLHMPGKKEDADLLNSFQSTYHKRIIFDEFFYLELALALKKKGRSLQVGIKYDHADSCIIKLKKIIPFKLTSAQDNVVLEIASDMQSCKPMNRLIQGDVGSGKTIVALFAIYIAVKNGYQAAVMAPTEILASQHYKNLSQYFDKLGINAALLTSSLRKKEREATLKKIKTREIDLIIGTHALIQEGVEINRMGLAVIDEQHRFGVAQRTTLMKKGKSAGIDHPDVLIMTATPIPRTLAITVYGDLDVSIIDEMPPGRIPVETKVFYESQRERVYELIKRELDAGNQAYIVYPLVSESEALDLMDATNMAQHLSQDIFPEFNVGLLHGKIKSKEKEGIMRRFKDGELDILVATTIIEVGVDIQTASIIVVEHAERFGLSQLHQLRGRVGRSDIPAKCILLAQYAKSEESTRRLKVMERTNDGFKIAEEDMAIRGPGEMLGTRQSGLPDFQVASLIRDLPILKTARKAAFSLIKEDPKLEKGVNRIIKKELIKRMKGKLKLASIG